MRIAIVGCGFVADYYMKTLPGHPELQVTGVYDRSRLRCAQFASHHNVPTYRSLEEVLADARVDIVLNLTNPRSHYEVGDSGRSRTLLVMPSWRQSSMIGVKIATVFPDNPSRGRGAPAQSMASCTERRGQVRRR